MENINTRRDFENLYKIQDEILELLKNKDIDFYLSGGTALHRFHYQDYRYSEDLDFFNHNQNYQENFDRFLELLSNNKIQFKIEANGNNFKRLIIKNELKIDFINEITPHLESLEKINGIFIDNKENILANKLTAVIGRSEPRDVYDIFILLKNNYFDKSKIINSFREKTSDEVDLMYSMLKSFPIKKINFKEIDFIGNDSYKEFINEYQSVIDLFINSQS